MVKNTFQVIEQLSQSEFPIQHLEDGLMKELLSSLLHPKDIEDIVSKISNQMQPINWFHQAKNKNFVTAECLLKDKKMTFKDKCLLCDLSFQNIQSLQTLHQELTSNESPLEPFWSSQAKDLSKKLWLPTETDCVVSLSNSLNGSFNSTEQNSWFSMKFWSPMDNQNLQKICLPLSMFSIAESMEKENIQKPKKSLANSCRRIRLYPSKEDTKTLKKWFGCVRVTYNWALSCIKNKPDEYYKTNYQWLRKRFVVKKRIPKSKKFLLDTPKHVRDTAVKDLANAFKANFSVLSKNKNHRFDIKFRSKKDNQAFTIEKTAIKKILHSDDHSEFSMYPTFLKNKIKFYYRKRDPKFFNVQSDCKLVLDTLGRFYLSIPMHVTARENQASGKNDWCSLDPGVKTFLTGYSPQGIGFKIGDKDISRITRLCVHLDKLISKQSDIKNQRRKLKRYKKAEIRLRLKIKHLVDEVHWKAITYLTQNYKNIIIPPFNVSNMVKKTSRKIGRKTVRQMLSWRHGKFKERLLQKAYIANVNVFIRGEEYTTKTCTNCMKINPKIKGERLLKCPYCQIKVDRDFSGSRNIFIKNISVIS